MVIRERESCTITTQQILKFSELAELGIDTQDIDPFMQTDDGESLDETTCIVAFGITEYAYTSQIIVDVRSFFENQGLDMSDNIHTPIVCIGQILTDKNLRRMWSDGNYHIGIFINATQGFIPVQVTKIWNENGLGDYFDHFKFHLCECERMWARGDVFYFMEPKRKLSS